MVTTTIKIACHTATGALHKPQGSWQLWSRPIPGRRGTNKIPTQLSARVENANGVEVANFVDEMRSYAMNLHTKEQAPKEGKKELDDKEKSRRKFEPTREGYLQFLIDSKVVYDILETIMSDADSHPYTLFTNTGLERGEALAKDIAFLSETYDMQAADSTEAGKAYAAYLRDLSVSSPPRYLCHYYNVYFAHTAGGLMIGKKVSDVCLDGKTLEFYKWHEGNVRNLLKAVKGNINTVAENWSSDERKECLEETPACFERAGQLLRLISSR